MNIDLIELTKMFADGTPLDAEQLGALLDNGLIRELASGRPDPQGYRAFEFTQTGAQVLKNNP